MATLWLNQGALSPTFHVPHGPYRNLWGESRTRRVSPALTPPFCAILHFHSLEPSCGGAELPRGALCSHIPRQGVEPELLYLQLSPRSVKWPYWNFCQEGKGHNWSLSACLLPLSLSFFSLLHSNRKLNFDSYFSSLNYFFRSSYPPPYGWETLSAE